MKSIRKLLEVTNTNMANLKAIINISNLLLPTSPLIYPNEYHTTKVDTSSIKHTIEPLTLVTPTLISPSSTKNHSLNATSSTLPLTTLSQPTYTNTTPLNHNHSINTSLEPALPKTLPQKPKPITKATEYNIDKVIILPYFIVYLYSNPNLINSPPNSLL